MYAQSADKLFRASRFRPVAPSPSLPVVFFDLS